VKYTPSEERSWRIWPSKSGTALQKVAGFIDKTVPYIDIGDARLGGHIAIERIQEQR
jgi:hypothetical protein